MDRFDSLQATPSRRQMLKDFANGFAMLPLASLLAEDTSLSAAVSPAGAAAHLAPRAKNLIFLFMSGGPSQVDTFDPKPQLQMNDGKPLPFEKPDSIKKHTNNLLASPFKFARHGECGTEVSELLPHLAGCVDDLCVIRSLVCDNFSHNGACLQMNTGETAFSRPSLGSWLLYGLGSENRDLPGFVVLAPSQPAQGARLWTSSFLPAKYQGTRVQDLDNPIANIGNSTVPIDRQQKQLETLNRLNELHRQQHAEDSRLSARIKAFELAFRMQSTAPLAFDVGRETASTQQLYGIDGSITDIFGRQCLMARRLVERGVRTVQVYHTDSKYRSSFQIWDQHDGLRQELIHNCQSIDKPVAGLLQDLKARGLLDETLVVWGGEFGRSPTAQSLDGRDHNPFGFTMWMAGGGIKSGMTYGATDDFGWHAVENRIHVHDLHATILHLMGLDHERLTYRYSGRDYRLTDIFGNVVHDILV
jgi:hypothetical protein